MTLEGLGFLHRLKGRARRAVRNRGNFRRPPASRPPAWWSVFSRHVCCSLFFTFLKVKKKWNEEALYALLGGVGGSPQQSYTNPKSWLSLHLQTENLAKVRSHARLWPKELWPTEWDYFPFSSLRAYHPTLRRTAHCDHEPPMGRCCLSMDPKSSFSSDLVNIDGIVLKHQGKGFRDSKCLRWKPLYLKSQGWPKYLFLQADGSVDANFAVWDSIAYAHIWQYL